MAVARISILALGASCSLLGACSEGAPPPNVIVVSIDTLNRSSLRAFDPNAAELPNLDRFAAQAAVFERAYSTSSWTLPAQASLLTGLYPDRHGATKEHLRIDPSVETLGHALRRCGYETVGFTDGGLMDGAFGFEAGFDRFNEDSAPDSGFPDIELPRDGAFTPISGSSLFDRAVAYLRGRSGAKPFFLFVQTYSVHDYFTVHPWAAEELRGRELRDGDYYSECLDGVRPASDSDWDDLRALYRAELRHLDQGFGHLLETLDERGLSASTVMWVVSDHGEGFEPQFGRIHHGGRLNSDLIRVPMLVRGPGIPAGRRAQSVSLVDVFPTVSELANQRPPSDADGRSFLPLLLGTGELEDRPVYAEEHTYAWIAGQRVQSKVVRTTPLSIAVIAGDHWYIRDADQGEELYRRREDPKQRVNLAERSHELARLRELADERGRRQSPVEWLEGDEELTRRLRELGYVER